MSEHTLDNLAMVFPGQGSQSVGMLNELAATCPIVKSTFKEASAVLGYDLWQRTQEGPEELLNQTSCTQPAMLTSGVAIWRCWQENSEFMPAMLAGHSLGEYTALVCAGVLGFTDAVDLVRQRGELMQQAVPKGSGAMAAILGLTDEQVIECCQQAAKGDVVSAANFNAQGQVVIAGNKSAVDRAVELAKTAGAKRAVPLPVSVPSHCELMRPAAEQFAALLDKLDFQMPAIPVLHNINATQSGSVENIRSALSQQMYSPVRWVETIQNMSAAGIRHVLEMGPGKVLAGLNKRIDKKLSTLPVQDTESLQTALDAGLPHQL